MGVVEGKSHIRRVAGAMKQWVENLGHADLIEESDLTNRALADLKNRRPET